MADVLLGLDGHCAAPIVKNFAGWSFWHRHRFITAADFKGRGGHTLRLEPGWANQEYILFCCGQCPSSSSLLSLIIYLLVFITLNISHGKQRRENNATTVNTCSQRLILVCSVCAALLTRPAMTLDITSMHSSQNANGCVLSTEPRHSLWMCSAFSVTGTLRGVERGTLGSGGQNFFLKALLLSAAQRQYS